MSYICLECGHTFEDGEQANWKESRGEFWGVSCFDTESGCPKCGGEYEEAVVCEICGAACLEDEINGGACNECINEYRKNFSVCHNISFGETKQIKINDLLASLFEPSDIEAILIEHIEKRCPDIDCSSFVDEDIYWFGEKLVEEVKKNENSKG